MNPGQPTRFDLDALRRLAGEKVFARGEAYQRAGQVSILSIEPQRVLAQVSGTDNYRTVLTGHGKQIGGECSCPAFEDWGFCKHLVAVALVVNDSGDDPGEAGAGVLGRIREYLRQQGVDALVAMVVQLAEHDLALLHRLDVASMAVRGDAGAQEQRLSKAIDRATTTNGFVEYAQVGDWAADVEGVLDAVAALAAGERADVALRLADQAIDRIEEAIGEIDDSAGHAGALLEQARDIHLAAARAAHPEPVALARDLFARETESDFDSFAGAAELYADTLGAPGLAEYRRLAEEAWAKLPPRTGAVQPRSDSTGNYHGLIAILDFFAERDGDVEARIALRSKDLSSPWSYVGLVEFCIAQGRDAEALRRAEEGLWVFADARPDLRLVFLAADLLEKAGRDKDAEAQLWRAFQAMPGLELHARLCRLGGSAAVTRAVAFLQARLAKTPESRWDNPADLLVQVLQQDEQFDVAWMAVRAHRVSGGVKEALALASQATHPNEAVAVYAEKAEELATGGGNHSYEAAATLIARMAGLRSAIEHAAYVAAFKQRHSRKRNLMRLLS